MATYRQVHTKIWDDKNFKELSIFAQHLFIYLFTNSHRNEACFYEITFATISYESKLSYEQITESFSELEAHKMAFYDAEWNLALVTHAIIYQSPNDRVKRSVVEYCNLSRSEKLRSEFIKLHIKEKWYQTYIKEPNAVTFLINSYSVAIQSNQQGLTTGLQNPVSINTNNNINNSLEEGSGEKPLPKPKTNLSEIPELAEAKRLFHIHDDTDSVTIPTTSEEITA